MKKVLIFLILVILSHTINAQFANTQTIGSNSTLFKSKGGLAADSVMVWLNSYPDTTAANLSVASKYNSIIRIGTAYWYRTLSPNKWNLFASGVTGGFVPNSDTAAILAGYKTFYPRTAISGGTGITYSSSTGVVTNSLPDQTVVLTNGTGITITGTYPNFTINNTSPSSGGTLTSLGTNNGTGINGGTITTTGTLAIDTLNLATRKWRQKGTDSVMGQVATKIGFSDSTTILAGRWLPNRSNDSATALQSRIETKQPLLTLTTTGTSGVSTLTGSTLNIPNYVTATPTLQQVTTAGNTSTNVINLTGVDNGYILDTNKGYFTYRAADNSIFSTSGVGVNYTTGTTDATSSAYIATNSINRFRINATGSPYFYNIPSAATSKVVYYDTATGAVSYGSNSSGTYTQVLTNVANTSSLTSYGATYIRVGDIVTVSFRLAVSPTASNTDTQFDFSLPTTGGQSNAAGSFSSGLSNLENGIIGLGSGGSSNLVRFKFYSKGTTSIELYGTFAYYIYTPLEP